MRRTTWSRNADAIIDSLCLCGNTIFPLQEPTLESNEGYVAHKIRLYGFFRVAVPFNTSFAQDTASVNQQILEELQALRVRVAALETKVATLKSGSSSAKFHARKADDAALNAIVLPTDESDNALITYIRKIVAASRKQNSFSTGDPQVEMLVRVGEDHVNLLIDELSAKSSLSSNYHLIEAINELVGERDKDLVLDQLIDHPALIEAVTEQGWISDARELLMTGLQMEPDYLPQEWIDAVASFKDPESYPLLSEYFIYGGGNKTTIYEAIHELPGFPLVHTVDAAWIETEGDSSCTHSGMTAIAALFGHLDALDELFLILADKNEDSWSKKHARKAIRRLTHFHGSPSEMPTWYEDHKNSLVYDPETRRYYSE